MSRAYTRLGLGLALVALACGPKGPGSTKSPTTGGADGTTAETGEVAIAYRPATLRSKATVELTSTGGGVYLQATGTVRATLQIETTDEGTRVAWDIDGVDGLKIDGTLPPPATDPAAYLAEHGKGLWVLDAAGREDVGATDAHPGNLERRKLVAAEAKRLTDARAAGKAASPDVAATLLDRLPPMLALPAVPLQPLTPGGIDEQTTTTEIEMPQFDVVLPVESTRRVTLVVVDASGTHRLAELQITEDRYAGYELAEGGDIELEEKIEGTLLFDLDRGIPYRFEQTTTTSFTAGELGSDTTRIVRAEFEPVP